MSAQKLTDEELRELLIAVSLNPASGAESYMLCFDELDFDSLARFELASRIGDRLVNERASALA